MAEDRAGSVLPSGVFRGVHCMDVAMKRDLAFEIRCIRAELERLHDLPNHELRAEQGELEAIARCAESIVARLKLKEAA